MNRYLAIPATVFSVRDPSTDLPAVDALGNPATTTAAEVCRALLMDPKIKEALDALDRYDLREKLVAGGVAELTEAEHAALVAVVKRPSTLSDAALYSPDVAKFLRTIVDASSVRPP